MMLEEATIPIACHADATAHVLLVAEAGFSILDIYARSRSCLGVTEIQRFVDQVNARNEAASLHPNAPISAIPRKCLRALAADITPDTLIEFKRHLRHFFGINAQVIKAKKIVIDLRVSSEPVPQQYLTACREILNDATATRGVDEVVLAR